MGGTNSKYISDLSDTSDSSDQESLSDLEEHRTSNSAGPGPARPAGNAVPLNITVDAAFRTNVSLPKAHDVLSANKVLEIESRLDIEEIVSLVFLLFEEVPYALQELSLLLRGNCDKKPLHAWAVIQERLNTNWQNKFIEALCVIKNYEALRKLGYRKNLIISHFLPHNGAISIHLNKVKKTLYLICEQLNSAKTKTLLDHVKRQFPEENIETDGNNLFFLELCFMNWEVSKNVTLSNIKKILQIMGEEHLCNILDEVLLDVNVSEREKSEQIPSVTPQYQESPVELSLIEQNTSQSIRDAFFENQLPSTSNSNNNTKHNSTTSVDNHLQQEQYVRYDPFMDYQLPLANITQNRGEEKTCYEVNPDNPGIVLIINQENFYTEIDKKYQKLLPSGTTEKLESRLGTEKDKEDLVKIFKKYGFTIIVENDLSHLDMVDKIKEVVKSVGDESSLFVCILSHGDKGIVYGANSCRVKVNRIKEIMYKVNKGKLTNKPKILILQSCQGQQCQSVDENEEYMDDDDLSLTTDGPSAPMRDMLTFWATIPGYAAIRNKRTGSWFIQALCKKMEEIGNKYHFADICTRVANEVTSQIWTKNEDKKVMTPYVQTTLLKDFFLPPLKNES